MERLTPLEGRVLASLVEKDLTIPQHYPLTLHALLAACNQVSNREPVTAFTEDGLLGALESLKAKRMVRAVLPSHGRSVVRYRHVLDEALGLDAPQLSVIAVLELRGPQTVAELRVRTERMGMIESVDHELGLLAAREEPLVERVGRRSGEKGDRWASLLAGPVSREPDPRGVEPLHPDVEELRRDVDTVRAELETLRDALETLRAGLDDLRTSLGG
ncbi:MAG: DUF480 domain-containing protein [Acidimicrobiales bacterium]